MKKILLYLILIMAIAMAGTVAYVSVSGLLKVFTGAGTMGLIFFTAIEIAKIVATSAIHTYGKKIGWLGNGLLTICIIISMAITSMGIYGFLSSSYKESFAKMENVDGQVELLENKRNSYQKQLNSIITEKETLNITISDLTKGLANNVIQYKDKETGEIITTTSSSTRRVLEKQLDKAVVRQEIVNDKSEDLNTMMFDLENDILETKLGNESANELGTLKYLADVTGQTMDDVMKWFILLLIVIGDPMAVLMVIVFNKVINSNDDDNVGGLPMDSLIGDKPKEPIVDTVTGHIDLPEEALPMEEDIWMGTDGNGVYDGSGTIPATTFDTEYEFEEVADEEDDAVNDAVNDVVNDTANEFDESHALDQVMNNMVGGMEIEGLEEPTNPNPAEMIVKEKKEKVKMDEPIVLGEDIGFDPQLEIENTPEEQIVENVEEVKQLKREPIVPRGKIIESDVIKTADRGFSVEVPDPKVTKVGSQKEIHEDKPNVFFFKRKRSDELGD